MADIDDELALESMPSLDLSNLPMIASTSDLDFMVLETGKASALAEASEDVSLDIADVDFASILQDLDTSPQHSSEDSDSDPNDPNDDLLELMLQETNDRSTMALVQSEDSNPVDLSTKDQEDLLVSSEKQPEEDVEVMEDDSSESEMDDCSDI